MKRTPAEIVRCDRMLTEMQRGAPDDVAVLNGMGRALLTGREPLEALKAFELELLLKPNSATSKEDVGLAYLESGQTEKAASHLERPWNWIRSYSQQGRHSERSTEGRGKAIMLMRWRNECVAPC